jgi:diaminohydroxyphosphoribosylaminopyrimidine deaminase / 5-amino-6-(5-phosphoribosylamino)uracil reductase
MSDHAADEQFMQRALNLARQGISLASPNPCVGAVIVDAHGNVAGIGTHTYDGVKHAEIIALEQAGGTARNGTLYINLEPCSHQGRTPPCADALIAAGIRRVVASISDPNPAVAGRGFEKLRDAGMQVEVGGMAEQARRLNESFARYIRNGLPLVTLKSAMTLDGKIAPWPAASERQSLNRAPGTPPGGWITGEAARAHVQKLRHENDALLVGIGAVLSDDPLLTDRSGLPRRRPLLRVVLDSRLRVPPDSRIVHNASNDDLLIFCTEGTEEKKALLQERGVRVEKLPADNKGRIDLPGALRRLGKLEITSVMIEGGSTVNAAVLAAGVVDKVFFYYAPKIFADPAAVPFASGLGGGIADPVAIKSPRIYRFEEDFAVEGYIRDPYQE